MTGNKIHCGCIFLSLFDDPTSLTEEEMYELRNNWATCFLDLYNPEVDYVVSDDEVYELASYNGFTLTRMF
ncbi:unnamed protein product [Trifolium pratense]|nr:unnamed protein product [Trifolium pratense]